MNATLIFSLVTAIIAAGMSLGVLYNQVAQHEVRLEKMQNITESMDVISFRLTDIDKRLDKIEIHIRSLNDNI